MVCIVFIAFRGVFHRIERKCFRNLGAVFLSKGLIFNVMDDSKKSLEYLISVEKLAEEILADRRSITQCDKRRNENREALRAIQKQSEKKCWLAVGPNLFKCPLAETVQLIEKDQKQLDIDINKMRSELKVKLNKFRDLEHQPPVPGLMLVPLSQEDTSALSNGLNVM